MSKFKQILVWLGVERFVEEEIAVAAMRKENPCQYCINRGGLQCHVAPKHSRRSSQKCLGYTPRERPSPAEMAANPDKYENILRVLLCESDSDSEDEGPLSDYNVPGRA